MDPAVYLSVFGAMSVTAVFWGGYKLGAIDMRIKSHEELDMHEMARKNFVPRTEINLLINGIANDIKDIKDDVKFIKNGKS